MTVTEQKDEEGERGGSRELAVFEPKHDRALNPLGGRWPASAVKGPSQLTLAPCAPPAHRAFKAAGERRAGGAVR